MSRIVPGTYRDFPDDRSPWLRRRAARFLLPGLLRRLRVVASFSLTVASLATYAGVIPQEWARFTALVQRAVFVIAGGYALYRVTRRG